MLKVESNAELRRDTHLSVKHIILKWIRNTQEKDGSYPIGSLSL